jgi:hypothetical protein
LFVCLFVCLRSVLLTEIEQKLRPKVSHFGNQIANTPLRSNVNATPVDKQILGFTFVR